MTWVIGRAGPFGHAIGLSDIRITLADGTERDCLQKVYLIGSQLVLGFAGSVAIGLEIVAQLGTALHVPNREGIWDPLFVADMLPIGTRQLFNMFPDELKTLGCELMLLSAHPTQNDGAAPWARCYVHRFYSPNFEPVEADPAQIVSIGSGSDVKPYAEALEALSRDMDMFNLEVGMPGGSGLNLMASVSSLLARTPTSGISHHLHICIVGRDGVRIGTNSGVTPGQPEAKETMPRVAKSMEELKELLEEGSAASIQHATC
jgi:hypothetical protein